MNLQALSITMRRGFLFEKIDNCRRSEFIEKGGWDKIPGQKEAASGVACACVTGIKALAKYYMISQDKKYGGVSIISIRCNVSKTNGR